jgi:hypothetical protein
VGAIHSGIPREHVAFLRSRGAHAGLVETGTYEGSTAEWASQQFPLVHTVEASGQLYAAARQRLARRANVTAHHGHSREVLETLVPALAGSWLFWLDAHWSGGSTYGAGDECPLLGELAIALRGTPHSVLVDDARFFLSPPRAPHDWKSWPQIDAVCEAVRVHSTAGHRVTVYEDVIWILPPDLHAEWCEYLHGLESRSPAPSPRRSRLEWLLGR